MRILAFVVELFMVLTLVGLLAMVVGPSVLLVRWALRKEPPAKPPKDVQV